MADNERRHNQRVPFVADIFLSRDDQQWQCELHDISLKGLLIVVPEVVEPDLNHSYTVDLKLSDDADIKMTANISHQENLYWGMAWENIELDGFMHLRRLLELNINDPNRISCEIADLSYNRQ